MDQIELRHLRYFLAVAEELHFGRAANRLHMAQPPLSQQIRRLEEMIGFPLFARSSRSVKLTPAGEALRERASRTVSRVHEDIEAARSVGRGEEGALTVGFVGSAMLTRLPAMLGRYRALYPRVKLSLREFHTSQLEEGIREGAIHVGLVRDIGMTEDLRAEALLTEPLIAVLPKGHALAKHTTVPIVDLREEPFVFFPRSAGTYAWENTVQLCERQGFRPNVVQEAPQWLTILRLVGAGLGVTIAPAAVEKIATPEVACRRLSPAGGTTNIELVYRADEPSSLVKAFCALARGTFGSKASIVE
jgi:DNA-binding transcriptional LysR family regulator